MSAQVLTSLCPFLGDAAVLNNVAHTFGLMDTVKKVLDNRKNQTEQGEEQFLYTLAGKGPNKSSHPAAPLGNGHDFPFPQLISVSVQYRLPQNKCIPILFCPRA